MVGINNLSNLVSPEYIRLKASFIESGDKRLVGERKKVNTGIRGILNLFKSNPHSIDAYDGFEVKYINKDGEEEDFSLLKSKKEVVINIEYNMRPKDVFELIDTEFGIFIEELNQE